MGQRTDRQMDKNMQRNTSSCYVRSKLPEVRMSAERTLGPHVGEARAWGPRPDELETSLCPGDWALGQVCERLQGQSYSPRRRPRSARCRECGRQQVARAILWPGSNSTETVETTGVLSTHLMSREDEGVLVGARLRVSISLQEEEEAGPEQAEVDSGLGHSRCP